MLPDHPELMPIKETKMVVWEEDKEEEWVVEIDMEEEEIEEKEDINKEKEENLLM